MRHLSPLNLDPFALRALQIGLKPSRMTKNGRYEKPQKGNKYGLTVKQHIFPRASIARFVGPSGCVDILDLCRGLRRPGSPKDELFCAMRAWSQREEAGFMRSIESDYQALANQIVDGTLEALSSNDQRSISWFFALWYMRARHRTLEKQEIHVNAASGSKLTKEQEEILESKGIGYIRENGNIPARQINGMQLQMKVTDYAANTLSLTSWNVIHATEGEFLVPDVPEYTIVPLSPTICLVANSQHGSITRKNLAEINGALFLSSKAYVIARDLRKCPVLLPPTARRLAW